MPSPFTLTGTEEEFKKLFPNLKLGNLVIVFSGRHTTRTPA